MLRKIVSFGFKHGIPLHEAGIVLDVSRIFRNPYIDVQLRMLNGKDGRVQEFIMKTPNFNALYKHLKEQARAPGIEVLYVGCVGGHHRSVFIAEKLGKDLGVPVEHRDISRH